MSNSSVTVRYRTKKTYCNCCGQTVKDASPSPVREFEFTKEGFSNYGENWGDYLEYEEDLQQVVPEYVYETISFFATSSDDKIIIEHSEIEKVIEFIRREFKTGKDLD